MTNVELFCMLYTDSLKSLEASHKLAPRLAEIWSEMSPNDRETAHTLMKLPPATETNYTDA